MRITGGEFRGRTLQAPPRGTSTRPTTDKVRQAVFNVMGRTVQGASVLDLFAGTGAMGLEALSRGARRATFVEADPRLCAVIQANASAVGVLDHCDVLRRDVRRLSAEAPGAPFDVVFVDPPYELGLATDALEALATEGLVADSAVIVVEHGRRERVELGPRGSARFERVEQRRYGDTEIAWYNARPSERGRP